MARSCPECRSGYAAPVSSTRYRCTACGNLTRFDVTSTSTVRAFHHFSVGGALTVEDEAVLERTVDEVSCRWCGTDAHVVEVDDAEVDGPAVDDPPGERAG